MAGLYKKVINGEPYFYLREMAREDGKPKMVSERYLGSAADIVAAMDRAEAGMIPDRTRHLAFVTSPRCGRCSPNSMWPA